MSNPFFYDETLFDKVTNENIKEWLSSNCSEKYKQEIISKISSDPFFIRDAFSKKLYFGTGGLRALMRVGSNSMNIYTVRAASQGLVNSLLKDTFSYKDKSVIIGYDNRHHSKEFALEAAKIFANNAFTVYLYNSVAPIALVSFGVLYTHSLVGVMITASHNPAVYNGYKAFANYGGQVVAPLDEQIAFEISKVKISDIVNIKDDSEYNISFVGKEIFESYIYKINSFQLYPDINKIHGSSIKVIYTNLHGTGITFIPRVLKDWGFSSVFLVKEQMNLDGDFPTVTVPNPEEDSVLSLGIEHLKNQNGDILIATDPDCDRLGIAILYEKEVFYFNGNQLACLLAEYICSTLQSQGNLKKNHCIVKTLVTTELLNEIVKNYKINIVDVLTGFKYIGEKINDWIFSHEYEFLFGAEESQGYLYRDHVRDKDAVLVSALTVEMTLYFKLKGKSIADALFFIYQKYGWYHTKTIQLNFPNQSDDIILEIMTQLRNRISLSFSELGRKEIFCIEDYFTGNIIFVGNDVKKSNLPKSNVVRILFKDGSKVVFRPSGTEPKLKLYFEIVDKNKFNSLHEALHVLDLQLESFIKNVRSELKI